MEKMEKMLIDLSQKMEDGFKKVDKRFEQIDERFGQIDERFEQIDERFEQMDGRMDRLEKEQRETRILIENDVMHKIQIIAENHLNLDRKLNQINERLDEMAEENIPMRVEKLERDVKELQTCSA